jgi:hypothetical protein
MAWEMFTNAEIRNVAAMLLAVSIAACSTNSARSETGLRAQARAYARDDIPCQSDSDCCTVVDGCVSQTYVVSAADQATVTELTQEAMRVERDVCNACIPPAVEVACGPAGFCVGAERCGSWLAHCGRTDAGACPSGALSVTGPPRRSQAVFGCGL